MVLNSPTYRKAITAAAEEIDVPGGNILITGASGLIGSCIIDVLYAANQYFKKKFRIYALSRNEKELRERFGGSPEVQCVAQSVTEPILLEHIDYIIHAASYADPNSYVSFPVETILTNVIGTKNVLEYCKNNAARVLFISSFEVYGQSDCDKYGEGDYGILDLGLLRNCYPESKRAAECLCKAYHAEYHVDCLVSRLPSIFGPTMRMGDNKAHAQFIRSALEGKNIVLHSPGTQRRTYCYLMDAVRAILYILFYGESGEVYNVANNSSITTIAELAKVIAARAGREVVFDYQLDLETKGYSKPQNCVLNSNKIHALGWKGKYDIREGLEETFRILHEVRDIGT